MRVLGGIFAIEWGSKYSHAGQSLSMPHAASKQTPVKRDHLRRQISKSRKEAVWKENANPNSCEIWRYELHG